MSSTAGAVAHERRKMINAGQKTRCRAGALVIFPEKEDGISAIALEAAG